MLSFTIYLIIAAVGFMMTYLYKKSNTYAQFFNPNPKSSMRIFLGVFVTALLSSFGLSFYSLYVLKSNHIALDASISYNYLQSTLEVIINLSFLLLIFLCNIHTLSAKKLAWVSYLLAFSYYAIFIIKVGYFVTPYYLQWHAQNHLQETITDEQTEVIAAWLKVALGFAVTAANAFMAWWALKK